MKSTFWSELFFTETVSFFGGGGVPQKIPKLKVSDFDEIWYLGVFEGADFKDCILFSVKSCSGAHSGFFWSPCPLPQIVEIQSLSDFDEIW